MVGRMEILVNNDGDDDISIGNYRQESQQNKKHREKRGGLKHVQLLAEERHDWSVQMWSAAQIGIFVLIGLL